MRPRVPDALVMRRCQPEVEFRRGSERNLQRKYARTSTGAADISARAKERTKREPYAGRSREAHPHEPESVRIRLWGGITTWFPARFARLLIGGVKSRTTWFPARFARLRTVLAFMISKD